MKTPVSLVKCTTYDRPDVNRAVSEALDLLGSIKRYVNPGNRVLLKFNLLTGAPPEKAITTHPEVVRAVIDQVRKAQAVPLVGDCSGYEGPANKNRYYSACRLAGIEQACAEEGVELVHLSAESIDVDNPQGRAFKHFTLAKGVVEADAVINLPKLKTHGLCLFTGGVKNNFGCLPGLLKAQMHLRAQGVEYFSQMLVDLLLAVKPTLTVMDAVVGMEGDGPNNGNPKQIGAILASADPVALDAVACEMVGIEPLMVPTTRLAYEQEIGMGDLEQIDLLGEPLETMRVTGFQLPSGPAAFFRARGLLSFLQGRLVAKPALVTDRCKGCWVCIEHCPAEALSKNKRTPVFDYDKCIRCYCCQELCPNDAIELRRPLLARLVR
ncbi:MAG: DUF362 domain-containing protein [Actinobacteria bacterium]|nr:DUF362 domain-containing protein [Actinomycetota bacterium]